MGKRNTAVFLLLSTLGTLTLPLTSGQTYLRADGVTDTYTLINDVMGSYGASEVPDCGHNVKHIWQGNDGELNRQVFYFHAHVSEDNDRCMNYDRQRTEIRPDKDSLKGYSGETVTHSWNFKLDAAFQPSNSFTHIHQLKAVGGDDSMPLITLTPRKESPDSLQLIHVDSAGRTTYLGSTPLSAYKGVWIHARQESRYGTNGVYSIRLTRVSDGGTVFTYTKNNIDMWRSGASYIRPKWGIYRSLNNQDQLRDETVRFDTFCMAKGSSVCN